MIIFFVGIVLIICLVQNKMNQIIINNIFNYTYLNPFLNLSNINNYIVAPNYINQLYFPNINTDYELINFDEDFDYEIIDLSILDNIDYIVSEISQDKEEDELEYIIEDL